MGYYLLDHPNPNGDHFYTTRRRPLLAQIMHITAGLQDLDGAPDLSAERTAEYAATTTREVSWHTGSDTDGWLALLPYDYTAFQCIGYNSSTAGHEISKSDTDWRDMPEWWVAATLQQAANAILPELILHDIPIRKTTKAELDAAIAAGGPPVGLLGHHELDPDRRTDPGLYQGMQTFPWERFLTLLRSQGLAPSPQARSTSDMYILRCDGHALLLVSGTKRTSIRTNTDRVTLLNAGVPEYNLTGNSTLYAQIVNELL